MIKKEKFLSDPPQVFYKSCTVQFYADDFHMNLNFHAQLTFMWNKQDLLLGKKGDKKSMNILRNSAKQCLSRPELVQKLRLHISQ